MAKPTDKQIEEQWDKASEVAMGALPSRYPGMSYEEGVEAALAWVTGNSDDAPMED